MSSASLRSPPLRPPRMKKDESFLGKLGGTLARKKKAREVSDLQEEGRHAIDSPMSPASVDVHPEDTVLEENEERTMIDPTSKDDPKFKELVKLEVGSGDPPKALKTPCTAGPQTQSIKSAPQTRFSTSASAVGPEVPATRPCSHGG